MGYARERELQAAERARFVEEKLAVRDLHVVLMGDFDDTPDSSSVRFWTGRQSLEGLSVAYRDAWEAVHPADPGHTFSPINPLVPAGEMSLELGRRIDYILVRCGSAWAFPRSPRLPTNLRPGDERHLGERPLRCGRGLGAGLSARGLDWVIGTP